MSKVGRIIVLEQNSPEWHARRERGIGASEIPTIMGENPYGSARAWWEIRTGRRQKQFDNAFMAHGRANEAMVRTAYAKVLGEPIEPCTYESLLCPVLHASLDGITFDEDIAVEIKCPKTPKVYEAALSGVVPPVYYGQVQAQLFVTGAREAHFVVYYEKARMEENLHLVVVRVKPNPEYLGQMLDTVSVMWARVKANAWEPGVGNEYYTSQNEEFQMFARQWHELKEQAGPLEAALEKCESNLKRLAAGKKSIEGCGIRISEVNKKGNVDYSSIPELKSVNLDSYRKPGTSYYKIEKK